MADREGDLDRLDHLDGLGHTAWEPSHHEFSVSATIAGTADTLSQDGTTWVRETFVPILAYMVLGLVMSRDPSGESPFSMSFWPTLLTVASLAAIGVRCCRFAAAGPGALPRSWGLSFSWREMRFLGWMGGTLLLALIVFVPTALLMTALVRDPLGAALAAVGTLYLLVRVSLVLPASAVGRRIKLEDSWHLTRSNGRRLALLPVLALAPAALWMSLCTGLSALLGMRDQFTSGALVYNMSVFLAALLAWIGTSLLMGRAFAWFAPADSGRWWAELGKPK